MEEVDLFDDIRPFTDGEVPEVLQRIMREEPKFMGLAQRFFPDLSLEALQQKLGSIESIIDFQSQMIYPPVDHNLATLSKGLTGSGFEQLDAKKAYVFISNHRDIVFDSALLNYLLYEKGFNTTEIAIGNNLLLEPWIADLVRLNRSCIVQRTLAGRQQLAFSIRFSKYIRQTVAQENQSLWIAQKEGRTKDGNDKTQPSLLKMLSISGSKSLAENFAEIPIVPLAIQYEYDPCIVHKLWELEPDSEALSSEEDRAVDAENMIDSWMGFKGRIHFTARPALTKEVLEKVCSFDSAKENLKALAEYIDREIYHGYQLFPNNYLALDLLTGKRAHTAHYSSEDEKAFQSYLETTCSKAHRKVPDLAQKIIRSYAYPAANQLGVAID